tara:strand:- start:217 stop:1131 length:915 start_codon:yes stop_codon:yes gene_type:complete
MTKSLDTLIPDIYALLQQENTVNEDNLKALGEEITSVVRDRLESSKGFRQPNIRCSNLGVKDRKLYYDMNVKEEEMKEVRFKSSDLIKFMYGDIIEALLIFFCKEAGHSVTGEQGEVEIDGVIGHRDCIIDGITTDIKSASKFAFQKFDKGTLHQDDPFGYIAQISSYVHADESPYGAFLAQCKETGQLALLKVDKMDMIHPPTRIAHVRDMLEKDAPPEEKCYPPEPQNKGKNAKDNGNIILAKGCGWCPHKKKCWAGNNDGEGLRSFRYSNGIVDFVHVEKEPKVEEITHWGKVQTDKKDKE